MRQNRTLLGVALALVLGTATARGQPIDPPHKPPADALGAIHDMRLTILARRALARDRVLAPLRLGVEVRQGAALLWGDVPSDAVAKQAEVKLEAIDGIFEVRSELRPGRVAGRDSALADLSVPARVPPRLLKVEAAKPDAQTSTIKKRLVVVGGEGMKAVRPGTLPPPPGPIPGPPPRVERAATPAPRAEPLAEAVAKLKASQARFRAIPVAVRGDVVEITRRGDDEDVAALAQALRRVRGVSEVRMKNE